MLMRNLPEAEKAYDYDDFSLLKQSSIHEIMWIFKSHYEWETSKQVCQDDEY